MIARMQTLILLSIITLVVAACQPVALQPPAERVMPEMLVQELATALNAGNVDAAMAVMSDNPTFTTDETITGADEVRAFYQELVAGDFRIEPTVVSVENDIIKTKTLTWGMGIPPGLEPFEADEVYIITNGHISSITWTPTEETLAKIQTFTAEMENAAKPEETSLTIAFTGNECSYSGMETLPALKNISFSIDVTDQDAYEGYGFSLVTLDEDKTMADLEAWPSSSKPVWTQLLASASTESGTEYTGRSATFPEGTAYLVCFICCDSTGGVTKTNVVGPIEIVRQ